MEYNAKYNTYRATDTGHWIPIPSRRDARGTIYYACPTCGAEDHDKQWLLEHLAQAGHDTDPWQG